MTVPVTQCGTQKWPNLGCFLIKSPVFWLTVARFFQLKCVLSLFASCLIPMKVSVFKTNNQSRCDTVCEAVWRLYFWHFFDYFYLISQRTFQTHIPAWPPTHTWSKQCVWASCIVSCMYYAPVCSLFCMQAVLQNILHSNFEPLEGVLATLV